MHEGLSGAFNIVAPEPTTNAEFATTLGNILDRPSYLPVPGTAIQFLLGEMGETLMLRGRRIVPHRLFDEGFSYLTPSLEQCLRWELGIPSASGFADMGHLPIPVATAVAPSDPTPHAVGPSASSPGDDDLTPSAGYPLVPPPPV
jgi:hypothetical protein